MGAVTFTADSRLLDLLRTCHSFDRFVETGTFRGDTVALACERFPHVISVELSPTLHAAAVERFRWAQNVDIRQGDSPAVLAEMGRRLRDGATLYYLDAHWCEAEGTSGKVSQCPLLDELAAIGSINDRSVVLIDDARLFLAPPAHPHEISQWPSFDRILLALRSLSDRHRVTVVNDVIVFFPCTVEPAVTEYARTCGVDWLEAARSLVDCKALRTDLEAKNLVIQSLREAMDLPRAATGHDEQRLEDVILSQAQAAQRELEAKERVITEQRGALKAYRAAFFFLRPFMPLIRRAGGIGSLFYPKLGRLSHHGPLPISLPPQRDWPSGATAPSIAIVTPSFRQAHFLEATLNSVLDQHYPALEYFVQDGGSDDGTTDLLRRYEARLNGWVSAPDGGQSQAINLGFAQTSGEIMAWLNSDDLLMPGALALVAEYFASHPEVDVVYGHRILIDEEGHEIGRWVMPPHSDKVLSWADFVPQETLFWRRSLWEKVGGIDESFRFAMDWDLLLRFRDAGARMVRLPYFLGAFRIHEAQKTSAQINEVGMREMTRLRQRALGRVVTGTEIKAALLPYLARHIGHDLAFRIRKRMRNSA